MTLKTKLNTKLKTTLLVPATLLVAILAPSPCAAGGTGLTVTLNPKTLTVGTRTNHDQTFIFEATLTNTSATALYFNGDFSSIDSPLTLDDSPFQNTFVFPVDQNGNFLSQPTLAGGASLTVPLFEVTVPAHTPYGFYNGTFDLQGGPTSNDYGLLAAPTFTIDAAPVPEAPTSTAYGIGMVLLGVFAFARRRKLPVSPIP